MKVRSNIESFIDNEARSLINSMESNNVVFMSHLTPAHKNKLKPLPAPQ